MQRSFSSGVKTAARAMDIARTFSKGLYINQELAAPVSGALKRH
jgi:hypothetical protein